MSEAARSEIKDRRAIVTGCKGQDGSYLAESLESDGVEVLGIARDATVRNGRRGPAVDLTDRQSVSDLVADFRPHEIYHLAAEHHSSALGEQDNEALLRRSTEIHVDALTHLLNAVLDHAPGCRIFYAASSRVYGDPVESPQTELTPFHPHCAYGITKAAGLEVCRSFRTTHGLHVNGGILYNHDSPRRPSDFLIPNLIAEAMRVQRGEADAISVGDLDAEADWGYAPEYTDAMRRILAHDEPQDYVVASGELCSVRRVVAAVLAQLGLPDDTPISQNPERLVSRQAEGAVVGDASRIFDATGWRAQTGIDGIVGAILDDARTREHSNAS